MRTPCDYAGTEHPCWGPVQALELVVDGGRIPAQLCSGHRNLPGSGEYRWRVKKKPYDSGPGLLPLEIARSLDAEILRPGSNVTGQIRWLRARGYYVTPADLLDRFVRIYPKETS